MPSSNAALTASYRRTQADLVAVAYRDLLAFWRSLDRSDPIAASRALQEFLPELVQAYGEVGAAVAADFYDELRDASPHVRRSYVARMSNVVPIEQARTSARWAMTPMFRDGDTATALTNLAGVTRRLVLAPARDTVADNTLRDPDAIGWRRVGNGDSCRFCRMLIGRGEVYSAETVRFAAHDHCNCLAEPAWGAGTPIRVEQYVASKRDMTDADRRRVREYLAQMDDTPAPGERRIPNLRVAD